MGTEFYIVDMAARRALDLHKAYWIIDALDATTLSPILQAFDDGDPDRYCHQPRVRVAVETWVNEFTTGQLEVFSDAIADDMPFEDERGYLLDSWEGWAVFGTWPDPSRWKPWMGYPAEAL